MLLSRPENGTFHAWVFVYSLLALLFSSVDEILRPIFYLKTKHNSSVLWTKRAAFLFSSAKIEVYPILSCPVRPFIHSFLLYSPAAPIRDDDDESSSCLMICRRCLEMERANNRRDRLARFALNTKQERGSFDTSDFVLVPSSYNTYVQIVKDVAEQVSIYVYFPNMGTFVAAMLFLSSS